MTNGGPKAVDRATLQGIEAERSERYPWTRRRVDRVEAVLRRRQPDLTVVLENVHDPHNVSAVLRSADAVGVAMVHLIYTVEEPPHLSKRTQAASGAAQWLDLLRHDSIEHGYQALRNQGFRILATGLGDDAVNLYDLDLTMPTALVFGNEMRGVSEEAARAADGLMAIPMMGMVESLNISVACAVSLFEAMRQRRAGGMYDDPRIEEEERQRVMERWLAR